MAPAGKAGELDADALRASFDYSLNGILQGDADGRLVACNPAASSILGLPRRRIVGSSLGDILAPQGSARERWARHGETVAEQGVSLITLPYTRSGEARFIELASVDMGQGRLLHILDDITERRNLTESLESARRAADEANAAKSAFLAHMSHEIRTPLNGIVGMERLLRLTPLSAQQAEYLDDLGRAARTLLALLGDVLDLSRIEAQALALESRPFDADEFLETVAAACAPAAAAKDLKVVFDVDPAVPARWEGDPLRLAQAVSNLLANAIKFTDGGHVVLAASCALEAGARGWLRLAVRDTGIGMTAEQLERVFSPFVQADASVNRRFGGSGLGLAIARGIVERMGGEIGAASRPGAGSEFVIRVPMAFAGAAAPDVSKGSLRRATLSLADEVERQALANLLDREGYGVATGGGEGGAAGMRQPGEVAVERDAAGLSVQGPGGKAPLREPVTPLRLRRAIAHCVGGAGAGATDDDPLESLRGAYAGASALVVEDDPVSRRVTADLLAHAGIDVRVAEDGVAACEALLAPGARPVQLILMDLHMPRRDGLAATRALRDAGVATPIVALSAGVSAAERDACLAAGMSDWLPKPPELADLEGVLARWLQPGAAPAIRPEAPPDPAAGVAAEALPGIDLEGALRRFLGNRAAFDAALAAFVRERRGDVERAGSALQGGDLETLARLAHGIAGSAALLGAVDVQAAARDLERYARSANEPAMAAAAARLRETFDAVAGSRNRFP